MKKYILFIALMMAIGACTEKDIEVNPTTDNTLTFYKQESNVEYILWQCYNSLWVRTGPWGNTHKGWGNFPSDDAYTGGSDDNDQQTYQDADKYQVSPLDPAANLTTQWRINFQGIYACNLLIDNVPDNKDFFRQAIAEAKFLKAFYYFELARMFGGLPLLKNTLPSSDQVPRSSYDETLAYIAELLEDAINMKRLDGTTPALQQRTTTKDPDNGRATLASAQALLGKVYLYLKEYQKTINILTEIDNNPNYQLEPNFADIFNANNKHGMESIFEINYSKVDGPKSEALGNGEVQLYGPRPATITQFNDEILAGWGFDQPTQNLVDAFKSQNDFIRLNATIISNDSLQTIYDKYQTDNGKSTETIVWQNSKDGYWDAKMLPRASNKGKAWGNFLNNTVVLRLADVYLMLAEAYNRSDNDAAAQIYLKKVRDRVGLPPVTATGNALFEAIKLERRLELALEGERYFDLLRWDDAEAVLGPLGWNEGSPGKKTNGLFPIPQAEIDKTSGPNKLTQNPGY